jgi:DNA-3-methyladenine glycosylase
MLPLRCHPGEMPMLNFDQNIVDLARKLVGAQLLVRGVGGTVLETEAYGRDDPASHSFRGPSMRNAAMFGPPGTVYVYLSYGCHLCLNVVGRPGEAVLIRAIRPEVGLEVMQARRGHRAAVASGPGRVGQALGILLRDSGKRFGAGEFLLKPAAPAASILTGPRIGITRAADLPWRFGLAGATGHSRPFATTRPQQGTNPLA